MRVVPVVLALAVLAVLAVPARAENGGSPLLPPDGTGGAAPGAVRAPGPQPPPPPKSAKPRSPRRTGHRPVHQRPARRLARFPVLGPHGFGGPDARFGAPRRGHLHPGQDVTAALGTPLVAPRGGPIVRRGDQPRGAGLYLVVHGDDGRDYVLMHLQARSIRVTEGQRVRAGQIVAAVGRTGDSSGPHLHFEIWLGGWRAPGGRPVDPLADLLAWDAYS